MPSNPSVLRTGGRGYLFEIRMAFADFRGSIARWYLAWSLGRHDIAARYRGSILGPFWITLSMGAMVVGLGVLYSRLFHMDIRHFLPFIAIGIVLWSLIGGLLNEGCDTFTTAAAILQQTALPLFTFEWRTVSRGLIAFAHHLVIVVAVLVWARAFTSNYLLAGLGLMLVVVNLSWLSLVVAIASARFRDVPQVVISVMQFAMFMTPVFWRPDQLPRNTALLTYNPFYYMLEAVRAPLLGVAPDPRSWAVLIAIALFGWLAAFSLFAVTRRRVVHFL
jgi:homopolymeric O-antigen transport system permease protein